jgi:hypothetical protein
VEYDSSQLRNIQRSVEAVQRSADAAQRSAEAAQRSVEVAQADIGIRVDGISDSVRQAVAMYRGLEEGLTSLRKQVSAFIEEDRLARNMQFAQSALTEVRAEIDRKFGHHESVRRGTTGMLQAMDAGIVTQATLQQAAERLMIDAPGYWLAPVLVALAAWIRNSRALAEDAVRTAMSRDRNKTALFFSLVLARYERYEATAEWIKEYFRQQDHTALPREFVVVLDAVVQGALGGRARSIVRERCLGWYEQLGQLDDRVREQQIKWREQMSERRISLGGGYQVLPELCPDWSSVLEWLNGATVHAQTERALRGRFETPIVHYQDLRDRVDKIVDNLITQYDDEEAPLRKQALIWHTIVEHRGNHSTAEAAVEKATGGGESLADFLTLLTSIGIHPAATGASPPTQQMAIVLASDWIMQAAHELAADNRDSKPGDIKLAIEGWERGVALGDSEEVLAAEFTGFVDQEVRRQVQEVNLRKPRFSFWACSALLLGALAFFLSVPVTASAVTLITTGALFLLSGAWLLRSRRSLPGRKENLIASGEARKEYGTQHIRSALVEIRSLFEQWETELANEESLVSFIEGEVANAGRASMFSLEDSPPAAPGPAVVDYHIQQSPVASDAERMHLPYADDATDRLAERLPQWDLVPPQSRSGPGSL